MTAFKEQLSPKRFGSAESFSTGHRMEVVEQVPIRASKLVHLHHVCVEGGEKGLALPHLRSFEQLGASLNGFQPGSHKPVAFRVMDPQEMVTTIFPPTSNASNPGATQVCMNTCVHAWWTIRGLMRSNRLQSFFTHRYMARRFSSTVGTVHLTIQTLPIG